jgi:hypothetical protein
MGSGGRQRNRNDCVDGLARPWPSARANAAGAVYERTERAVTHLLRAMGNVPAVCSLWRVAVCTSPCPCGLTLVAADALSAALPPTRAAEHDVMHYDGGNMIAEKIKALVAPSSEIKIPKPKAKGPFLIKGIGKKRTEEALIYLIPSHKQITKHYKKSITLSEIEKAHRLKGLNGLRLVSPHF